MKISLLVLAGLFSLVVMYPLSQAGSAMASDGVTVYRDSRYVDLSGKVLPANDYIHLYDTTPYKLMVGHVAVKVPCNANSEPAIQVLIGQAPNLVAPDELEYIAELSTPGKMCLYHVDLASTDEQTITDVAIKNPTSTDITFPNTSSVVIGVDEIMPGAEEGGGGMTGMETPTSPETPSGLSPLQQMANGVPPAEVTCNDGLELIKKTIDGSAVCVSHSTATKLLERGWAESF
jgi:hypothetical protein